MKHKYVLTIEFETEKPISKHSDSLVQFENGLGYFVDTKHISDNLLYGSNKKSSINETFVYGTGKTKLKKVSK